VIAKLVRDEIRGVTSISPVRSAEVAAVADLKERRDARFFPRVTTERPTERVVDMEVSRNKDLGFLGESRGSEAQYCTQVVYQNGEYLANTILAVMLFRISSQRFSCENG
jgi:hypothetical protein